MRRPLMTSFDIPMSNCTSEGYEFCQELREMEHVK